MNVSLDQNKVSAFVFDYKHFILAPISISIDLVFVFIIKKAQKKLVKIEYYLLMALLINLILMKILESTIYIIYTAVSRIFCIFFYSFLWTSWIQYFWILFYFSLYHLSSLGAVKFFFKLKIVIQKPIHFIIYNLVVLSVFFAYLLIICFILQNDIFDSKYQNCSLQSKWKYFESTIILFLILAHVFPSIMTITVYNTSSILIIKRILIKKSNYSINELRHYSKMLKVLIKFFLFNLFSNLNLSFLIVLSINFIFRKIDLRIIIFYLDTISFNAVYFQTLVLSMAHNRLKKELILNLKSILNCLKRQKN